MLVQLVIAAITMSPSVSLASSSLVPDLASPMFPFLPVCVSAINSSNAGFAWRSKILSCGRLGPARLGSTVPMSSSTRSVNMGSGVAVSRHSP